MDAFGIAQVEPGVAGIHVFWHGPPSWTYAPGGWTVQRRLANRLEANDCQRLEAPAIADLRLVREKTLSFGVVTLRAGQWLDATPAEVFRFDLARACRLVRVSVSSARSFAVGFCAGRVVAVKGPVTGNAEHLLRAQRIDAVVVLTGNPSMVQVCLDPPGSEAAGWDGAKEIVTGLTMPFRELMPELGSEADELAEARGRLRPGETLGAEEFARLAAVIRPVLRAAGPPPPPAELALLLREEPAADPEEARALDPVRVLLAHPTWRRALGFALFDDDPALAPGAIYEYRIRGTFPAEDVRDRNHGFATVPSGTLLPTDFSLDGMRLRLPQPVTVGLTETTPPDGPALLTRRGIPLEARRDPFWVVPTFDDWSLIVDFGHPVREVSLELADGHDLSFAAGPVSQPVPAGTRPRLDLGAPVDQLRLRGKGFLHALRVSTASQDEVTTVTAVTVPIPFTNTPPPSAPLSASAENLQAPPQVPVLTADVPPRHDLGFRITWRPAPAFGVTAWPAELEAAPPLDATIFQVERRVEPNGDWLAVHDEDNLTFGDRDGGVRDVRLTPGTDVLAAFPESASRPAGDALDMSLVDATGDTLAPETLVRYRVRAVDAIGRPSPQWTETAAVRLEKHLPPPVPVGPDHESGVTGVAARVLVRDAPDLTAAERTLLGTSDNAIVLRWGWHAQQRDQDPFVREFRVYLAPRLDAVGGEVLGVTTLATGQVTSYRVDLRLDRPVPADVAAGLRLNAGHPFLIRSHTGGSTIAMTVETRLPVAGVAPVPTLGPVRLNHPLTPELARPPAWAARIQVVPLTTATAYQVVLRDRLTLTAGHPDDALWAGVSAADDQSYVDDQLPEQRHGNESAIAPVFAAGRYAGRPELAIPPQPLSAVPRLVTPEPGAEPVHFPLDLRVFLPPAAFAAGRVRHERVAAGALVAACRATTEGVVLAVPVEPLAPGDVEVEVPVPNPADRAELVAALRSGPSTAVADRFLVYLAERHHYRDRLFAPAHDVPVGGAFAETLPPAADRWLYRVRAVDAAGHLSSGSATARVVVRVPSLSAGAPPVRVPRQPAEPPTLLRVRVPADPTLSHVLLFHTPSTGTGPVEATEISRVPNRPDLLPAGGLWLRAPNGHLLNPTATPLAGVVAGEDGVRELMLTVPGGSRVWLATLTHDGVPSTPAGPYTVGV